jgi:hypothetical protein
VPRRSSSAIAAGTAAPAPSPRRARRAEHPRRARVATTALAVLAVMVAAGCARRNEPVIPRAASIQRHAHRDAIEGTDTTLARLSWPEYVGARTPAALDSLQAAVHVLALAPAGGGTRTAKSVASLLDGFIAQWNAHRKASRRRVYWRLDRRIEEAGDTFGVVSLASTEFTYAGGAHPLTTVRFRNVGADDGRTIGFADLFRADARDSLSAAVEPVFRAARSLPPDTSLKAAGFWFADDRFHVNDNLALTADGVRWHFDPYEIAPYVWGPSDFVVPFATVLPFARPDGPLGARRR